MHNLQQWETLTVIQ